MKIQGIFVLSVRTYLGIYDAHSAWKHHKYVVGSIEDGKIRDYQTGELHDYIERDETNYSISPKDIEVGHVYAVEASSPLIRGQSYSKHQINRFIKKSNFFTEEYKNYNNKHIKTMIKK